MKNRERIGIINTKSEFYREVGNYSRNVFTCDIVLKSFFTTELLGRYKCNYLLKKEGENQFIEYPECDLVSEIEVFAPTEWNIAMVTEHFPQKNQPIIQATFNIYKQLHTLGNHKFYDTKIVDILS